MNSSAPLWVASIAVTMGTAPMVQAEDQPSSNPTPGQSAASQPAANQPAANQPAAPEPSQAAQPQLDSLQAPDWVVNLRSDILNQPPIGAAIEPVSPPVNPPVNPPEAPALAEPLGTRIEPAPLTPIQPVQTQAVKTPPIGQPEPSPEPARLEPASDLTPAPLQSAPVPLAQPSSIQPSSIQPSPESPGSITPELFPTPQPSPPTIAPHQPAQPELTPSPLAQPFPEKIEPPDVVSPPNVASPIGEAPQDENRAIPAPDLGPSEFNLPNQSLQPQSNQPGLLDLASNAKADAIQRLDAPMIAVTQPLPDDWWHQGAQSPIAIAIGTAEGTRTPDGGKNQAYYWHRDPGNGADNFGTFSYQHLSDREQTPVDQQPSSDQKRHQANRQGLPETADRRQLAKLQSFYQQLLAQAHLRGLALSELEILNGLDLANQSEEAALDSWGYIDRLIQAKSRTADPQAQINQARTWSYWNPKSNRWDAPGLGNHYDGIQHDQQRRSAAITAAFTRQQSQAILAQAGNLLSLSRPSTVTAAEHRQAIDQLTSSILRFETDRVN